MGGLARICKQFGRLEVSSKGEKVIWIYDYVNNKPRLESEMTKEEIMASEKKKYECIKNNFK